MPNCKVTYQNFSLIKTFTFQRPSAKDLMRHPFMKKAKRTAFLQDLIDRYKRWKVEKGPGDSDSDSDE